MPQGPPIWICGDCHVGNLGPLADTDGQIDIEIRDLDQTVIGNPAHDLIRLGLSLATAARGSDLPGVTTAKMIEQMVEGYEEALADKDPDLRSRRPECVRVVMRQAVGRTWDHLAKERLEDTNPTIPLGKRFWPISQDERREIERIFATEDVRLLGYGIALARKRRERRSARCRLLDERVQLPWPAALCGIVRSWQKPHQRRRPLSDRHQGGGAGGGTAPSRGRDAGGPWDARRRGRSALVASAWRPHAGLRAFLDRAVFMRELLPEDLKLEIDQISREEAMKAARYLAMVVGKAHARQMDVVTRAKWRDELGRNRSANLEAPNWLWSSIVELVASHEAAYLEHCRRYAMDPDLGV